MNRLRQPITQPSIPSSSQNGFDLVLDGVQVLRNQLNDAQETIRRYTDIIVSQAHELTIYRNNVCQHCRLRLLPTAPSSSEVTADVPVVSSSGQRRRRSSSPSAVPDRRVRRRQASPTTAAPSPSTSQSDANDPPLSPSVVSMLLKVIPAALGTEMSTWSVKQNKKERQSLDVTFMRVFTHNVGVMSVRFSPDGKYLAVGLAYLLDWTDSGKVFIYDVRTGEENCIRVRFSIPPYYTGAVFSVCFSPNGRSLATGHSDGRIRLFDLSRKRIQAAFKRCKNAIDCINFSSNGQLLASVSGGEGIRIWNVRDGSCRIVLTDRLFFFSHCISFSPKGRYVAAGDPDHTLRIWDARTGRLVEKWAGHEERVYGVTFTPNGKELVSSSVDKTVKCWDISSLTAPVARSQDSMAKQAETKKEMITFQDHTNAVSSVAVSPDSLWVLSGSEDETAQIWNRCDSSQKCTLLGHKSSIRSVDFSPAGDYLAVGSLDGQVSVWKYRAT